MTPFRYALGLLAASLVVCGQPVSEKLKEQPKQEASQTAFILKAKRAVVAKLKDPDSAQFKDVRYGDSEETGPVAYGYVNAKNGFGGYTGFERFMSNGSTVLFEREHTQFSKAWESVTKK